MQIAVVNTHQRGIQGLQGTFQLIGIVHFNQHIQIDAFGNGSQLGHLHVIQRRDDQQNAIRPQCARFNDLIRIDHEVLADHRQLARRTGLLQVSIGTLKVVNVGQNRQTRCAAQLITFGNVGRNKIFTDHALARRCLFDFGNHRRLLEFGLGQQSFGKTAYRICLSRQTFKLRQAHACAALGDFLNFTRQNFFQNGRHTHASFSCLKIAVKAPSSSSFSRARPVCNASWAKATPSLSV